MTARTPKSSAGRENIPVGLQQGFDDPYDPYETLTQQARKIITEDVLSKMSARYCPDLKDPQTGLPNISHEEVLRLHRLMERTNSGVDRIYMMPNYELRKYDSIPSGNVVFYNREAKLSALAFGSIHRICEFTMLFEVTGGKNIQELANDRKLIKAVNDALRCFTTSDMGLGRGDEDTARAIGMFHRGVDTEPCLQDNTDSRMPFLDPFSFVSSDEDIQKRSVALLTQKDFKPWDACLGSEGVNHIDLSYSDEKVYIKVHSGAPASSRDLYSIALHYSRVCENMTLREFLGNYSWYKMHRDNSSRNCRRLAYQFATMLGLRIDSEIDSKAVVEDEDEDIKPRLGKPCLVQCVNCFESLSHIGDINKYDRYLDQLAKATESGKSLPLDACEDMFTRDSSKKTLVFFNMCAPNPLYHPYSYDYINTHTNSAFSHTNHPGMSGKKVHGSRVIDVTGDQAIAGYTVHRPKKTPDMFVVSSKDKHACEPVHHRFLVLFGPNTGSMICDILHKDPKHRFSQKDGRFKTQSSPGFVAWPIFAPRRTQKRENDAARTFVYEPAPVPAPKEEEPQKVLAPTSLLGIKFVSPVTETRKKKTHHTIPSVMHIYDGNVLKCEMPRKLELNNTYYPYESACLKVLVSMGFPIKKLPKLTGDREKAKYATDHIHVQHLRSHLMKHASTMNIEFDNDM